MKLSGYQSEAIERMLNPDGPTPTFGVYDVPGAGKTAVAINGHLQLDRFPALVTVPAHLVLQWKGELERWGVPSEEIGYCPRGMNQVKRLEQFTRDCAFQLVTYQMWTSEVFAPFLLHSSWGSYSFDEAHRLRKGRKGKGEVWQQVSKLRTKTRSKHMKTPVWLFTGTPIVKDATDVWPLLHLANPVRYSSRRNFAIDTCYTTQGKYSLYIGKVRDLERFHKQLGKWSIRRTWREIPELKGLKRRDIQLPLELEPRELARHRAIKKDYRDPLTGEAIYSSAAMIHALRRLTISAKVDTLAEVVEDHPGRWLALGWYKDCTRMAYDRARKLRGSHVGYIDGTTSERERQRVLAAYNSDPEYIIVGTIGALETGLNLQAGYQVAFLEQHWLPTSNEQAVDRLFRRGQSQPVLIYWMHCLKTFDMRVKRAAETRDANIEQALGEYLDEEEWAA